MKIISLTRETCLVIDAMKNDGTRFENFCQKHATPLDKFWILKPGNTNAKYFFNNTHQHSIYSNIFQYIMIQIFKWS